MDNRILRNLINEGLQIKEIRFGNIDVLDEQLKSIDNIVVEFHLSGQISYRFGNVYFSIIQTENNWKIALVIPPMDEPYEINWIDKAKMEFLTLPTVNLPILEALKTTNIYVVDDKEFFDQDSYYYSLYFGSRFLSGQLRLQGPSMDIKTHDLWQAILQTIGKLASFYDTVDAKIFLDRYSHYLGNQE